MKKIVILLLVLTIVLSVFVNTSLAQRILFKIEFIVIEDGKERVVESLRQIVMHGEWATKPTGAQWADKVWLDKETDKPYDFNARVEESKDLYTIIINYVNLNFDSNGGTAVDSQKIQKSKAGKRPLNPTRDGYKFVDWYNEKELTTKYDFNQVLDADKTVYAKWEKNVTSYVNLNFDSNGGTAVDSQKIQKSKAGKRPVNPTRDGYKFVDWYNEKELSTKYDFNQVLDADKTVYAKWEKNVTSYVNLNFDSNGGTAVDSQKIQKSKAGKRPVNPTRDGYKFVDWYNEKELTTKYDFNQVLITDKTVYAKWEKNVTPKPEPKKPPVEKVKKINVIFVSNGGTKVPTQIINKGDKAKIVKAPTRNGYRFVSWNKEKTLVNAFDFNTKLYKDTYLYAKWRKILPKTGTNNDYLYILGIIFIATGYLIKKKKFVK